MDAGFRLACAMLGDRYLAEDAMQESVLRAWTRISQLRQGPGAFRPWFLSIVANECRSLRRGRWWRVVTYSEPPERASAHTGDEAADRVDLWRAVLRLSQEDRAVLVLHYVVDLPLAEVASVLGISLGAAKTRVRRAAGRVRSDLAEVAR